MEMVFGAAFRPLRRGAEGPIAFVRRRRPESTLLECLLGEHALYWHGPESVFARRTETLPLGSIRDGGGGTFEEQLVPDCSWYRAPDPLASSTNTVTEV